RRIQRRPMWSACLFPVSLNDFQLLEEGDDLLVGIAFVLDDLTRFASGNRRDFNDLLAGAGPADVIAAKPEVGGSDLVDRLALGGHDALERRVTRLDDTSGDGDERG